ncbi:NUDIX domain-containing protein [Nocardia vaccinii]|uniref:NUDIX domain-containing protein n=1 Tax=Nocardia vaccinii TaxID=1822 RepID=UPI00082E254D|nr:NUDIX domain-containing protein [Nocardia vaccinii]
MQPATALVADIVTSIEPLDSLERQHIDHALAWLAGTDDIFRRAKPATPSQHLVSYVVLVDPDESGIFLGRHRLAGLHLPMGGHVEPGEHPRTAATREAAEELDIDAEFTVVGDRPLFLTVTQTVGKDLPHTDVSLWYVVRGSRNHEYSLDPREFDGGSWWDITRGTTPESDPHLGRFLTKLQAGISPGESA